MMDRIRAKNIGPVREADIRFGDLTIFVGPQATGKSIFLQLLKLLVDKPSIHDTMQHFGLWQHLEASDFFDLYFGEGMASIWNGNRSSLVLGQARKQTDLARISRPGRSDTPERMFYIPAQRVMSLRDGMTRPFSEYRAGDPYPVFDSKSSILEFSAVGSQ
ncbi:MAG: ATP-binding protein, partial [Boseongicola sp. SB0677_bin_26]|nr:ATP-binding protein [Boseongicola sp. SB0665_bin_10]MYG28277.1 ATP-binding protein [Boseongicola sp. SB0677_bin_26]